MALDDSGPYIRLEVAARTQKLTATEQMKDVDVCLQTLDLEIAKIGRNVFKEYCEIRVAPPDEFRVPCVAVSLLCGEEAVSWNALKKSLQKHSYMFLKESIREFRFDNLTQERYEHVNDFVRRNWEHLNFKRVSSVCESLAPISEWVKFQLKKFDLRETLRQNEDKRRSRRSMGARASLQRRLSSINNFTVSDQLASLSLDESEGQPPGAMRAGSMAMAPISEGAPMAPLSRPTTFAGGGNGEILSRRSASRGHNRRATVNLGNLTRANSSLGTRTSKRMSYRRVPPTISEDATTDNGTPVEGEQGASLAMKHIGGGTSGAGGGSASKRRSRRASSSSYFSMYTE